MNVGAQIRKFRKLRKMPLVELSAISGVQIATLSRMENSKMTGTVQSHVAIAKALGVDIADLYKDLMKDNGLDSTGEPLEAIPVTESKASQEILARQASSKKMLPVLIRIAPRGKSTKGTLPPGSERFIFALQGTVTAQIKGQAVTLKPGMSLYFNGGQEHYFENSGSSIVKILSIATPVNL